MQSVQGTLSTKIQQLQVNQKNVNNYNDVDFMFIYLIWRLIYKMEANIHDEGKYTKWRLIYKMEANI